FKGAVATIPPEAGRCSLLKIGGAVRLVCPLERTEEIRLRSPLYIFSNHEIHIPLAIEINPPPPGAELIRPRTAPFLFGVFGDALCISEQSALPNRSHEQIFIPVIVVIPDSDAHRIHLDVETCSVSNVRKRSVVVIAIEMQRGSPAMLARPVHTVREKQILPSV